MIDKFGQVMLYVNDVASAANFWIDNLEFEKMGELEHEEKLISVELSPNASSDTHLVLFDKEFVRENSPMVNLDAPSLLFSTYDIKNTHRKMLENGVKVSDIIDMQGMITFNFPDLENNYFAIREINKKEIYENSR